MRKLTKCFQRTGAIQGSPAKMKPRTPIIKGDLPALKLQIILEIITENLRPPESESGQHLHCAPVRCVSGAEGQSSTR